MKVRQGRPAFWRKLKAELEGDVAWDDFSRGRYATDASPYQSFPAGVVCPKSEQDLEVLVSMAQKEGLCLVPRGGGTSTRGQAVGDGIAVDFSRFFNRVVSIDVETMSARVQPGVTPAALDLALKAHGVAFPVVIASAQQATLGGMLANNSSGMRLLRYGPMSQNVRAVRALLSEGHFVSFGLIPEHDHEVENRELGFDRLLDLLQFGEFHQKAIEAAWHAAKFSEIEGEAYDLRALLPAKASQNLVKLLAGSEGTLALFTELEINLVHRVPNRAIGLCRFNSLSSAFKMLPAILALAPSAVELLDTPIVKAIAQTAKDDPQAARLVQGDPDVILFVEFDHENAVENTRSLKTLNDLISDHVKKPFSVVEILGRKAQAAFWRLRRNALSQIMSGNEARGPFAFPEDIKIPISALDNFANGIEALFVDFAIKPAFYGHVGSGILNIWPLGAMPPRHAKPFYERLEALVAKYNGVLTSGYGVGLAKGEALERFRGLKRTELYSGVKALLDPNGLYNPGKLTGVPRFDDVALLRVLPPRTDEGVCNGTSICRSQNPNDACPSFRITGKEQDSPRGRANSVRLADLGEFADNALGSEAMVETMRLCVSCKACRVACPNGVDVAAMRARVMHQAKMKRLPDRVQHLYARLPDFRRRAQRWRRLLNLRDTIPGVPFLSEKLTGVARDRPWPKWAARPFSVSETLRTGKHGTVALFSDTFNQAFEPENLRSAAHILEAAGFDVMAFQDESLQPLCCGRTYYDAGFFDEAKRHAARFVSAIERFASHEVPIVGLEPACVLMARDEHHRLGLETKASAALLLFEEFIAKKTRENALELPLKTIETELVLHNHCHERAAGLKSAALLALNLVPGLKIKETPPSCCGFNGGVGLTPDTVEASFAMAELDLFPTLRKAGKDVLIAATGFSCRKQIADGLGRVARHPASILNLALKGDVEIVT